MYQPLAPCPACSRHVKTTERICPFCKGPLSDALADAALPGASTRLTRAAAFAFTASIAVAATGAAGLEGCSGATVVEPSDAAATGDGTATDGAPKNDGPVDDGGVQALYGAVPVDAGPDTADDDGGVQALYGAVPVDSGPG